MRSISVFSFQLPLFFLLGACTTGLQVHQYATDAQNQDMLRNANAWVKSVSVTSEVSQLQKKKLACRGIFAVGLDDLSALQYFEKALNDELQAAQKLSERGRSVTVEIIRLKAFTDAYARWEIEAVLKVDGMNYPIAHSRRIQMSLGELSDGLFACRRVRAEFPEFVKEFNREIISKLAAPVTIRR